MMNGTAVRYKGANPPPPAGWSEPDDRGHITFVVHGPKGASMSAPEREGFVAYFVAVHGAAYTRWTYRPVTRG